jgi:NAD(P)-dependent dehydrogenase (short-subunit alcohol dehydrogenase family)
MTSGWLDAGASMRLDGRVAIVTGAARGIGFAIARRLASAGATIVAADKDGAGAAAAAAALEAAGGRGLGVEVDISRAEQVDALMARTIDVYGALDVLVNNAAHARYDFAVDLDEADWRYTLDVSLTGTFLCAQRAARIMRRSGRGKIVNITSISAHVGLARTVAYAASKGAVEAVTRVLAVELAGDGIQVNAIAPGPVDTEFSREVVSEEGRAARIARLPAGRLGDPEDVAGAALFLVAPASNWINGTVLAVDGGFMIAGASEARGEPAT